MGCLSSKQQPLLPRDEEAASWTRQEVQLWLKGIGLQKYQQQFQAVDGQLLVKLSREQVGLKVKDEWDLLCLEGALDKLRVHQDATGGGASCSRQPGARNVLAPETAISQPAKQQQQQQAPGAEAEAGAGVGPVVGDARAGKEAEEDIFELDPREWQRHHVQLWLQQIGLENYRPPFKLVSGKVLLSLSRERIMKRIPNEFDLCCFEEALADLKELCQAEQPEATPPQPATLSGKEQQSPLKGSEGGEVPPESSPELWTRHQVQQFLIAEGFGMYTDRFQAVTGHVLMQLDEHLVRMKIQDDVDTLCLLRALEKLKEEYGLVINEDRKISAWMEIAVRGEGGSLATTVKSDSSLPSSLAGASDMYSQHLRPPPHALPNMSPGDANSHAASASNLTQQQLHLVLQSRRPSNKLSSGHLSSADSVRSLASFPQQPLPEHPPEVLQMPDHSHEYNSPGALPRASSDTDLPALSFYRQASLAMPPSSGSSCRKKIKNVSIGLPERSAQSDSMLPRLRISSGGLERLPGACQVALPIAVQSCTTPSSSSASESSHSSYSAASFSSDHSESVGQAPTPPQLRSLPLTHTANHQAALAAILGVSSRESVDSVGPSFTGSIPGSSFTSGTPSRPAPPTEAMEAPHLNRAAKHEAALAAVMGMQRPRVPEPSPPDPRSASPAPLEAATAVIAATQAAAARLNWATSPGAAPLPGTLPRWENPPPQAAVPGGAALAGHHASLQAADPREAPGAGSRAAKHQAALAALLLGTGAGGRGGGSPAASALHPPSPASPATSSPILSPTAAARPPPAVPKHLAALLAVQQAAESAVHNGTEGTSAGSDASGIMSQEEVPKAAWGSGGGEGGSGVAAGGGGGADSPHQQAIMPPPQDGSGRGGPTRVSCFALLDLRCPFLTLLGLWLVRLFLAVNACEGRRIHIGRQVPLF